MNRYDIVSQANGSVTHVYYGNAPIEAQPEWGEPGTYTVAVTDITYDWELAECRRRRAAEYPPMGEQLDAIYKRDHLDEPAQWQAISAQIDAVKARYPKPVPVPPPFNPPPEGPAS